VADLTKVEQFYACWCKERFPLPTESEIDALEDGLQATLPSDYREFLFRFNGGFFRDPDISLHEACPDSAISFLHGIQVKYDFAKLGSDVGLFDDNYPVEILPIGYTPGNNLLCVAMFPDDDFGSVGLRTIQHKVHHVSDTFLEMFELIENKR
jgi:hypothetical protein